MTLFSFLMISALSFASTLCQDSNHPQKFTVTFSKLTKTASVFELVEGNLNHLVDLKCVPNRLRRIDKPSIDVGAFLCFDQTNNETKMSVLLFPDREPGAYIATLNSLSHGHTTILTKLSCRANP